MEENLRLKIDWASLIVGRKFTFFALFYFVFKGNCRVQDPRGLIFGGGGFKVIPLKLFYYQTFFLKLGLINNHDMNIKKMQ